ncbi:hypothetical protein Ahy_B08g093913 isoform C [Arachis hypogaea]|uniref:Uncharacterized protein n=1 Tax=Arachis hypogaea TaxID=3818 RepID=A0A444Y7E7_ARAHY|nr:hypothetical protein Ahy_B08g093913 isoform C [Arachis hypogaea]
MFTIFAAGVVCFGIAYYVQGVVTRERGPVFVTSFIPLIMIITAVLGTIVLAEQIHLGRKQKPASQFPWLHPELARLLSMTNGDPHNQSSTTVLKGTIGYAPPGSFSLLLRFLVVSFIVDLELFIMEKEASLILSIDAFCKLVKQHANVNDPKVRNLLLGGQRIIWRFPSSIKASKLAKYEFTPTKGSLTSGKQNNHQIDTPAQPQTQVDMNLSAKLYSALRLLRATILGESGDNVLAHHLMSKKVLRTKEELLELNGMSKAKVSNYGDQILETIENTINEYYKLDKSSNGSADSAKRRRDANGGLDRNLKDDDELTKKIKFVELTVMMSMNNENVGMICSKFVEHL